LIKKRSIFNNIDYQYIAYTNLLQKKIILESILNSYLHQNIILIVKQKNILSIKTFLISKKYSFLHIKKCRSESNNIDKEDHFFNKYNRIVLTNDKVKMLSKSEQHYQILVKLDITIDCIFKEGKFLKNRNNSFYKIISILHKNVNFSKNSIIVYNKYYKNHIKITQGRKVCLRNASLSIPESTILYPYNDIFTIFLIIKRRAINQMMLSQIIKQKSHYVYVNNDIKQIARFQKIKIHNFTLIRQQIVEIFINNRTVKNNLYISTKKMFINIGIDNGINDLALFINVIAALTKTNIGHFSCSTQIMKRSLYLEIDINSAQSVINKLEIIHKHELLECIKEKINDINFFLTKNDNKVSCCRARSSF